MKFNMKNYEFVTHTLPNGIQEVIAISHYRGKSVKGRAKCDPRDKFDSEIGKEYAALRCNSKIAEKRFKAAERKLKDVEEEFRKVNNRFNEVGVYYLRMKDDYKESVRLLEEFKGKI